MSCRLSGIHQKTRSPCPRDLADVGNRLYRAGDIRRVLHHDKTSVRSHGGLNIDRLDQAISPWRKSRDFDASILAEISQRSQYGIVFQLCRDDMIAPAAGARERHVQAIRSAVSEDDSLRVLRAQQSRRALAALIEDPLRFHRLSIGTSTDGNAALSLVTIHSVVDRDRFGEAGRSVVEIHSHGLLWEKGMEVGSRS